MSNQKKKQPSVSKRHRGVKPDSNVRTFLGGKISTPQDPPVVVYQPWNHLTLAWIKNPGDTNFGDLVNQIKAQLDPKTTGLKSSPAIQMKIHSVRVWNLTDKTIALTVYDFHDTDDADQLCGMMDAGTSGAPRLGYQLPLSHRNTVMRNDGTTGAKKLMTTSAQQHSNILHYVRLEWRFDGPVKGPTIDLNFERQLADQTRFQNENFGKVVAKIEKLIQIQPSLLERIVNGVVHSAAEVSLAAADIESLVEALRACKTGCSSPELLNADELSP